MSLCDFDNRLTVYEGYGNVASVVPYSDIRVSAKLDMTAATSVEVCVGAVTASSNDNPSYIWWEQADAEDPESDWIIHFKPGMFSSVPVGEQYAAIIVYSNTYPNGLVLTNKYPLLIEAIC